MGAVRQQGLSSVSPLIPPALTSGLETTRYPWISLDTDTTFVLAYSHTLQGSMYLFQLNYVTGKLQRLNR